MKKISLTLLLLIITELSLFGQGDLLKRVNTLLDNKKHDQVIELLNSKKDDFKSDAQYFYLLGSAYIDKLQATDNFFKKGTLASKAKNNLLKAIELKSSHIEARIRLCNYYFNAPVIAGGSNSKVMEQVNEIIKYDEIKGRMLLASIHIDNKEYQNAEKEYLKVYQINPNHESIYYALSNTYFGMNDYDKAFEYAKKSIDKFPNYLKGQYQYSRIASIANKNIAQGITYITYYIKQPYVDGNPKKYWAYYRLALLEKAQGKIEASKAALKKALELNPDFKQAKKLLD